MRPHEETISVGGIPVHTWVGGQGDPLLVLHGAGGNRGWRQWMERVAEQYTIWAPTHPGFGASGDAEWMEGVDDLARFYLWWIDAAGLGRPHLLGQSFGGWTAAEMATMSPGRDRPPRARRARRSQAGEGRDPRRLLSLTPAAA
jgi:pimeloyl-ACP methyl ester carboxylesterase